MRNFPIDFIRQIIVQTMEEEHIKQPLKYYGGANQVNLFSFYEQIAQDDEVNRYVENFRQLTNQENRTSLLMNGIIAAPENPTITNLNNCTIIPLSFTCSFRVKLGNRDDALETINHIIHLLKGRKFDVAELDNNKLFKVGTLGNNVFGKPQIKCGDFLGKCVNTTLDNYVSARMSDLILNYFFEAVNQNEDYYYVEDIKTTSPTRDELIVVRKVNGAFVRIYKNGTNSKDVLFPSSEHIVDKWQVSMSFDSIRCDEPMILNYDEYCTISFGGSATIVNARIRVGNELTKLGVQRKGIQAKVNISITDSIHWIEPLELPSSNNIGNQMRQLISNNFVNQSHNDNMSLSLQYTFVLDKDEEIINAWFKYARYGMQGISVVGDVEDYTYAITPNLIYNVYEFWSCWGEIELYKLETKIVESIEIENTESDTLSLTIPFQIQKEGQE